MNINNICLTCMKAEYDETGTCPLCGSKNNITNQDHQLAIRSILSGKYIIGRAIGQGGFGITYVAYDIKNNHRVAIKEFYPSGFVTRRRDGYTVVPYTSADLTIQFQTERGKFLEEAKKLVALGPIPNIVSVYDFFMENETAYIVMEYIEGETMKQRLGQNKTMLLADVITSLRPIAEALTTIHGKKLMHRDISPDNIMLSPEGAVLLDFGSARPMNIGSDLTKTINIKAGYAPFEQYDSHGNQGPWSDVYAFAATIYRAVTGIIPVPSYERTQVNDRLTPPGKLNKEITPEVEAVLLKGLACLPENRYQTVRAFFESLEKAAGAAKTKSGNTKRWRTAAIASMIIGAICTGVLLFTTFYFKDEADRYYGEYGWYSDKYLDSSEEAGELRDELKTLKDELKTLKRKYDTLDDDYNDIFDEAIVTENELEKVQKQYDEVVDFSKFGFLAKITDVYNTKNGGTRIEAGLKADAMRYLTIDYEIIYLDDTITSLKDELYMDIYMPDGTLNYNRSHWAAGEAYGHTRLVSSTREGGYSGYGWGNSDTSIYPAGTYTIHLVYRDTILCSRRVVIE